MMIGIDPGKHTGIAIADNGKLKDVFESHFWGAVYLIAEHPNAVVVVELPDTKHVWHKSQNKKAIAHSIGVDVGSVIREAELLIQYLERNDRPFIVKKPAGKLNADQFKRITGWAGRTNQHMRDACMLIVGISEKHFNGITNGN